MRNKLGLVVRYGDTCPKCGFSSCDHNEDPAGETCPGTKGNPGPINLGNYWEQYVSKVILLYDDQLEALGSELTAANDEVRRLREENERLKSIACAVGVRQLFDTALNRAAADGVSVSVAAQNCIRTHLLEAMNRCLKT